MFLENSFSRRKHDRLELETETGKRCTDRSTDPDVAAVVPDPVCRVCEGIMTRPYTSQYDKYPPVVVMEESAKKPVKKTYYNHRNVKMVMPDDLAWIYRGMIWLYGEDEAKERLYNIGVKKNGVAPSDNTIQFASSEDYSKEIIP